MVLVVAGFSVGCQEDIPVVQSKPELVVPGVLDHGPIYVGYSLVKELSIVNAGQGALDLSSVTLERGGQASDAQNFFELEDVPVAGTSLRSGESALVQIRFYAFQEAAATDTLIIQSNDEDDPETLVSLEAAGVIARANVQPASLTFSDVDVGQISTQNLTIGNPGSGKLKILNITFSDSLNGDVTYSFPDGFQMGYSIDPSWAIQLEVQYKPTDDITDSGTMTIETNAYQMPRIEVPITGNGIPNLAPELEILLPASGDTIYAGSAVVFSARVRDDRDLPDQMQLYWSSLDEGSLCEGGMSIDNGSEGGSGWGTITCADILSMAREQTIRLVAVDREGQVTTAEIKVTVWNEESQLSYRISGSASSSNYAFEPDDNLQVWVIDGVTGERAASPCVNDMTDEDRNQITPKTCNARFGDFLLIQGYDRYGPYFEVPTLFLWYGKQDEWNQPLVAEPYSPYSDGYVAPECQPTPTRSQWASTDPPEGETPPDCLVFEAMVQISIPPSGSSSPPQ